MKIEITVSDKQAEALRRQGLAAGFVREKKRQNKAWDKEETRDACRHALRYLMQCVTNTDEKKDKAP